MSRDKVLLVHTDGTRRKGTPHETHAEIEGSCQHCGVAPLRVQGTGRRIAQDDRAYEADGIAMCCSKFVGVIRVEVSTLFGLREDEAVMRHGVKIY